MEGELEDDHDEGGPEDEGVEGDQDEREGATNDSYDDGQLADESDKDRGMANGHTYFSCRNE